MPVNAVWVQLWLTSANFSGKKSGHYDIRKRIKHVWETVADF